MPSGVYKRIPGVKYGNVGRIITEETRAKLVASHLGQKAWNKGLKTGKQSPELVEKRICKLRGRPRAPFTEEWKRNLSLGKKGKKPTAEHLAATLAALPRGEKHHGWIADRTQ
jgi:hypothetical protein